MADYIFQDKLHKFLKQLKRAGKQKGIVLTPEQELKRAYMIAAEQECYICHAEEIHAVGKWVPPEVFAGKALMILYAICGDCILRSDRDRIVELKIIESLEQKVTVH